MGHHGEYEGPKSATFVAGQSLCIGDCCILSGLNPEQSFPQSGRTHPRPKGDEQRGSALKGREIDGMDGIGYVLVDF